MINSIMDSDRLSYHKKYYEQNKERIKQQATQRNEKIKKDDPEWYKYKSSKYAAKWLEKEDNRERQRLQSKQWRENNKEHIQEYRRSEAFKEKRRKRHAAKMQTDEAYKAKCALRCVVRSAFTRISKNKPTKTAKLLGCTWEEAKAHIEKFFKEGMTWSNYGKWHIDHIRPVSDFKDDELHLVNNISNLQPLWAIDNLKKGNKVLEKSS